MKKFIPITDWISTTDNALDLHDLSYSPKNSNLTVVLRNYNGMNLKDFVCLTFNNPFSFLWHNESNSVKMVNELIEIGVSLKISNFFELIESDYLKWFHDQCPIPRNYNSKFNPKHYLVIAENDMISVISEANPVIDINYNN